MLAVTSAVVLAVAASVLAEPVPLTPDTGIVGQPCAIQWQPDTTGIWKQTNIELMSGDNQNMVHITTVGTFDTTDAAATSTTWTCPDVTPNSNIYFYQYSTSVAPTNLTWTTRFTIAAADGSTTAPEHATQPDGSAIPWGIGNLVDPSEAKPAPAYITGQTSAGGSGSSASVSGSTAGSTSAAATTATTSAAGMSTVTSTKASVSVTQTRPLTSTTSTTTSGAETTRVGAALAFGAVAIGLLAMA